MCTKITYCCNALLLKMLLVWEQFLPYNCKCLFLLNTRWRGKSETLNMFNFTICNKEQLQTSCLRAWEKEIKCPRDIFSIPFRHWSPKQIKITYVHEMRCFQLVSILPSTSSWLSQFHLELNEEIIEKNYR